MKNPCCTFRDWRQRELERARARGGLHLFWFYMSMGLAWGLVMCVAVTLLEYHDEGALDAGRLQRHAAIYFVGGLLYGLILWVTQERRGAALPGQRP
jgi:hypothetical protein